MALVLENAQSELSPLEEGRHALHSNLSVRDYARRVGKDETAIQRRVQAARVAKVCDIADTQTLALHWSALAEIHAAPHSVAATEWIGWL